MAIAIKVGYPYHAPASRKSRPRQAGAENVVVKIPYRRLSRASIVKQVIRMAVLIKVSHAHHAPGHRPKSHVKLIPYGAAESLLNQKGVCPSSERRGKTGGTGGEAWVCHQRQQIDTDC